MTYEVAKGSPPRAQHSEAPFGFHGHVDEDLREETYRASLGAIINAHHAEPMAAIWGSGETSSSDGQFFRAGWRGQGSGEINAKYGIDPEVSLPT